MMKNISRVDRGFRWFDDVSNRILSNVEERRLHYAVYKAQSFQSDMDEYATFRSRPKLQWVNGVEKHIKSMQFKPFRTVCVCGSSKFRHEVRDAVRQETLAGKVVLAPEFFTQKQARKLSASDRRRLVDIHFRKIEMVDEILVINIGYYIGDATAAEVEYAKSLGKCIRYVEELPF